MNHFGWVSPSDICLIMITSLGLSFPSSGSTGDTDIAIIFPSWLKASDDMSVG